MHHGNLPDSSVFEYVSGATLAGQGRGTPHDPVALMV